MCEVEGTMLLVAPLALIEIELTLTTDFFNNLQLWYRMKRGVHEYVCVHVCTRVKNYNTVVYACYTSPPRPPTLQHLCYLNA